MMASTENEVMISDEYSSSSSYRNDKEQMIKEFSEVCEDYNELVKKLKLENSTLLSKVTNLKVENEKLERTLSSFVNGEKNLNMLLGSQKSYFDKTG